MTSNQEYVPSAEDLNDQLDPAAKQQIEKEIRTGYGDKSSLDQDILPPPTEDSPIIEDPEA